MFKKEYLNDKEIVDSASKLVSEGKIKESLELLKKLDYTKAYRKQIISIIARQELLERDERKGVVTFQDLNSERNKIIDSVLKAIADFDEVDENSISRSKIGTKISFGIIIGIIFISVLLFEFRRYKLEEVKKIDFEIAKRIEMIDISDWYRHALLKDDSNALKIYSHLIHNQDHQWFFYPTYKKEDLHSLLILLLEKVPPKEKKNIHDALGLLRQIESKYSDTSFIRDPMYVIKFYEQVIELNKMRWMIINNLDEKKLDQEISQLQMVFIETQR